MGRQFADTFQREHQALHLLVNNAGQAGGPASWQTEDNVNGLIQVYTANSRLPPSCCMQRPDKALGIAGQLPGPIPADEAPAAPAGTCSTLASGQREQHSAQARLVSPSTRAAVHAPCQRSCLQVWVDLHTRSLPAACLLQSVRPLAVHAPSRSRKQAAATLDAHRSKLANVLFAYELSRRWGSQGIQASPTHVLHAESSAIVESEACCAVAARHAQWIQAQ